MDIAPGVNSDRTDREEGTELQHGSMDGKTQSCCKDQATEVGKKDCGWLV